MRRPGSGNGSGRRRRCVPARPSIGITPIQRRCPGIRASNAGTKIRSQQSTEALRYRRLHLARTEPAGAHHSREHGQTERLRCRSACSIRSEIMAPTIPIQLRAACETGQHRGAVERRIERRIGCQREEKEERGDAQHETDQLIEPPVVGRIENRAEELSSGRNLHYRPRKTMRPTVSEARQSLTIMPRTGAADNEGIDRRIELASGAKGRQMSALG